MTHYVSALHDDIFVGGEKMSAIGIKKGCFAYANDSDDGCKALKKLYCRNEKCKFYKSMCQYLKEKEKYDS